MYWVAVEEAVAEYFSYMAEQTFMYGMYEKGYFYNKPTPK